MKKIFLIPFLALSAAFVACDEVEEMTGEPTVIPQLPLFEPSDLVISSPIGNAIDLPTLNSSGNKEVAVMQFVSVENIPEGYTLSYNFKMIAEEINHTPVIIPISLNEEGTTGTVTTAQLEDAYETFFGLETTPAKMISFIEVYAVSAGNSKIRLRYDYAPTSFTLTPDPVFVLYTPGDANGWNGANSCQLSSTNGFEFSGVAVLSPNGFKFTSAPGWDGTNYGAGAEDGVLSDDGSAGNLTVSDMGLYWCSVNTKTLTYSTTYLSTLGLIGSALPTGWDSSVALTPSDDFLTWTVTTTLSDGEFKIRANDAWDIDFGGSTDDLVFKGANIPSPGAGTYVVTLDFSAVPYTATLTKQ